MKRLLAGVEAGTRYEVAYDALPILFTSRVGREEQRRSLLFHAEKKVVALLLRGRRPGGAATSLRWRAGPRRSCCARER